MDQHSHLESARDSLATLEGQIRECFGRVVYSHKTHEKCADILLDRLSKIKVAQIVLSALAAGGFLVVVFGEGRVTGVVGAIIATALLVLNAYTKDHDLGEIAQRHRQAAADLWLVREEYMSLLTDLRMHSVPLDESRTRRDRLLVQLHAVYSGAPSTMVKAYRTAQKALQQLEELTFSDGEIDKFLPRCLRKNGV